MCLAHRVIRLTDHHKFKLRRRLKPTATRLWKAKVTVNLPDRGLSLIPRSLDRQDLTCCMTYSHPSSIMEFMTRLNRTYRQRPRPGRWASNVLHTFRCESNHPRQTCGWKTSLTVNSCKVHVNLGNCRLLYKRRTLHNTTYFEDELYILWMMLKYIDRKSTRLNSSHSGESRMPSSA